jgi:hypothetical protein
MIRSAAALQLEMTAVCPEAAMSPGGSGMAYRPYTG